MTQYNNPYSAGLWSKKKLDVNAQDLNRFKCLLNTIEDCVKVSDLQRIFKKCLKENSSRNLSALHSKEIKSYLERITRKEFPNHRYSFVSLCKENSRYATIVGLKVENTTTKESFVHDCNIEDLNLNIFSELGRARDIDKLMRQFKRIRGISLLRKCNRL